MEKGYVQIYTGDGKGKTTAAIGLAVRAAGQGLHVVIFQFLKGSVSGETEVLNAINNIRLVRVSNIKKFFWNMSDDEKADMKKLSQKALRQINVLLESGEVDVLVLDEALGALKNGIITLNDIYSLLDIRPENVEIVLTGRDAPQELVERADLVTQMNPIKHYMDQGVKARKGIEY